MARKTWLLAAAFLGVPLLSAGIAGMAQTARAKPPAWTYDGPAGTEHWAELSPAYAACAQHEQSPIDLTGAVPAKLGRLALAWRPVSTHVVRNGHAVEAEMGEGAADHLTLGGEAYTMVQFHLHHPAEHRIAGRSYPLEVHFVHRSARGTLSVVGVVFQEGRANPALQQMIDHARSDDAADRVVIDPRAFLPASAGYFRYEGSLTTPPCSEIVNWVVMAKPVTASPQQIAAVAAIYGNNARPLQPLGRRFLLVSE